MSSFYNASIRAKINCVTLCQVIPSSITFSWSGQSKTATANQKPKSHASRILHKQDQFETLVVLFAQDFATFVVAEHNHCSRGRWQRWAIAFSVPKRRQPTDEVFSSCVKWLKFAPNALPASIIMFTFCHCWTITTIYLLNCWQDVAIQRCYSERFAANIPFHHSDWNILSTGYMLALLVGSIQQQQKWS